MSKENGRESFEEIYNETKGIIGVVRMSMLSGSVDSEGANYLYFALRLAGEKLDQLFDIHRGKNEKGEAA